MLPAGDALVHREPGGLAGEERLHAREVLDPDKAAEGDAHGIARESSREIQGKGRAAWKNMVPQKLHSELWQGVMA